MKPRGLDISVFLIVYAVSMTYFILKTFNDPWLFSATLAFTVMASVSLFAALYTGSEEGYYANLTFAGLVYVVFAVAAMIAVSSFFMGVFASVLYFPTVFAALATTGVATSVFTSLMGEMVYQLAVVATAEELLKFVAYAELKNRYKSTFMAVALSVGFWAGFHALQAYKNVAYVIPAFLCGLILVWLLEYTKSVLAPIIAHGLYNTICVVSTYASNVSVNVPLFPAVLTSEDVLLTGLAALWIALIIMPTLARRR